MRPAEMFPFLCCSVYPCHVLTAHDHSCVRRSHGTRGFLGINIVPRAAQLRSPALDIDDVNDTAGKKV
ncbi:hypothetical protein M404DRAFT_649354 [Pisolithus tinctorius Marx 270]|uniref:Uncharacterized protein n=1 Tax=Pisolithus tinctorius Marx 270 TaxID=870435 RepID=A0A0C3P4W2_PISTI|nr:hypothetical protein M404DRAFT_649354 [Pisolithus tinctorius Marx 270]